MGIGAVLALAITACGGSSASSASSTTAPAAPLTNSAPAEVSSAKRAPARDDAIGMMQMFADEMCVCQDKACADKVNDDLMRWGQEMSRSETATQHEVSSAEAKTIAGDSERYSKCLSDISIAAANAGKL